MIFQCFNVLSDLYISQTVLCIECQFIKCNWVNCLVKFHFNKQNTSNRALKGHLSMGNTWKYSFFCFCLSHFCLTSHPLMGRSLATGRNVWAKVPASVSQLVRQSHSLLSAIWAIPVKTTFMSQNAYECHIYLYDNNTLFKIEHYNSFIVLAHFWYAFSGLVNYTTTS